MWVVVADSVSYTPSGSTASRKLVKGARVPDDEVAAAQAASSAAVKPVRRSWFSTIVVGVDNRSSTSKSVAFAWTMAIAWGLLSLVIAKWLGDASGYNEVNDGLQEEYLLLLGGPYAAAVLAKLTKTTGSSGADAPPAAAGNAGVSQLVTNNEGDADLGDFQYILFNLVGLAYFVGEFLGSADAGFPDLPPILAGLVLTSVGGYTAKKFIRAAQPSLTSVVPVSAAAGGTIQVYGQNLIIPASVSPTGTTMEPIVSVGGRPATVTAHDQILGADRLTVQVATGAVAGPGTITVVRADGVPAVGPAGADGLSFTVAAAS